MKHGALDAKTIKTLDQTNVPHVVRLDNHFGRNLFSISKTMRLEELLDPSNNTQIGEHNFKRQLTSQI